MNKLFCYVVFASDFLFFQTTADWMVVMRHYIEIPLALGSVRSESSSSVDFGQSTKNQFVPVRETSSDASFIIQRFQTSVVTRHCIKKHIQQLLFQSVLYLKN